MKTLLLLLSLSFVSASKLAAAETLDDFSKDSGLWTWSKGRSKGMHAIQNGRLEYATNRGSTTNDQATHFLKLPVGRYDESWEVQADVFNGTFALGKKNPYACLSMSVGNASKSSSSFIRLGLRRDDDIKRAFYADAYRERKFLGSKFLDATSLIATLKISYDAKTKTLTASHDSDGPGLVSGFVTIYSINIGSGQADWKMRDKDVFNFSMTSQTQGTEVAFGNMYFDNVAIRNFGK